MSPAPHPDGLLTAALGGDPERRPRPADAPLLTGQIRTHAMRTLLDAFACGAYPGGPQRVEQQGLDVLSLRADMVEPDGVTAEYETVITVSVVRRPK